MARTQIPVVTIIREGVESGLFTAGDPSNGMYFVGNEGNVELEVYNSGGSANSFTVETPLSVDGLQVEDLGPLSVPAGSTWKFGGFRRKTFNQDTTDGSVYLSNITDTVLQFRAFKFDSAG